MGLELIWTKIKSEQITQFGYNAYGKPSAALVVLREVVMGPELFDKAFVESRVEGFEALRDRVAPYTLEVAAKLCRVNAEDIRSAAELFAGARGANRHVFHHFR